jgi:hypothetical protein
MFLEFNHFTEDFQDEVDLDDVEVYNRHLSQGLVDPDDRESPKIVVNVSDIAKIGFIDYWPRGNQNIQVQGVFGYTDPAAGILVSGSLGPYALAAGHTLEIEVDGGAVQTVTFAAEDFVDIGVATTAEVGVVLERDIVGVTAGDEDGAVVVESQLVSSLSSLEVVGGTASAMFAFPEGVQSFPYGVTPELITHAANMMVVRALPVLTELDDHDRMRRGGRVTELKTMDETIKFGFGGVGNGNRHQDVGAFTGHPEIDNILAMYTRPIIGAWTS